MLKIDNMGDVEKKKHFFTKITQKLHLTQQIMQIALSDKERTLTGGSAANKTIEEEINRLKLAVIDVIMPQS